MPDSSQIKLPSDYYFGISAASAETADSFEAYKFVLTTSSITREEPRRDNPPPPSSPLLNSLPTLQEVVASSISSQEAQFADLHDRLQVIARALNSLFSEVTKLAEKSEGRHQELARNAMTTDKLNAMDQRLQSIESVVQDYQGQFSGLNSLMKESHSRLTVGLPQHMSESRSLFFRKIITRSLMIAQSFLPNPREWGYSFSLSYSFNSYW